MAIYTVGAGQDYADLTLAWNDKCKNKTLSEDVTFKIMLAHSLSAAITGTVTLNGYTVEITNNIDTVPFRWNTDIIISSAYSISMTIARGTGNFIVNNISVRGTGTFAERMLITPLGYPELTTRNITIKKCVFDNFLLSCICTYRTFNYIGNIKIFDTNNDLFSGFSLHCTGITYSLPFDNEGIVENVTIHKYRGTVDDSSIRIDSAWTTVKNIIGIDNDDNSIFIASGFDTPVTLNNCAVDDTISVNYTKNNCLENIIAANEFVSLDDTNEDYLKPKSTSQIGISGAVPSVAFEDIDGNPIPDRNGNYPIGCHALVIPAPISQAAFLEGDIRFVHSAFNGFADILLADSGRDVEADKGLETAVLISLFTDARENDEKLLPGNADYKGGWWATETLPSEYGSRLWLLRRSKNINEVTALAEQYVREALNWMILNEVAASIEVTATIAGSKILLLEIQIFRPEITDSNEYTYRYFFNWENQSVRRG